MRMWAVAAVAAVALWGCEDKNKAEKAVVSEPAAANPAPAAQKAEPTAGGQADAQNQVVYSFGPENSKIEFKGAKITGSHLGGFKQFKGEIRTQGDTAETGAVNLTIQTDSIYSDNDRLTGHLKSADFFDVQKFPTATFKSTSVTAGEGGKYKVTGELNMHGVTKQITFPATIAFADGKVTAKAQFSINRKEFGLVYPGAPDDLIRDDVEIMLEVNAAKADATGGSSAQTAPAGNAAGSTEGAAK